MLLNRNALFAGGIRPHHYCLPVLKREAHRQALIKAAMSGNPKFFLGTDSAPHARHTKETDCGCAGIYTAHAGIELYAEVFAAAGALDRLDGFASRHGAQFYGLPVNAGTITLSEEPWPVPARPAIRGRSAGAVPRRRQRGVEACVILNGGSFVKEEDGHRNNDGRAGSAPLRIGYPPG